jgi:hypothetical protein
MVLMHSVLQEDHGGSSLRMVKNDSICDLFLLFFVCISMF